MLVAQFFFDLYFKTFYYFYMWEPMVFKSLFQSNFWILFHFIGEYPEVRIPILEITFLSVFLFKCGFSQSSQTHISLSRLQIFLRSNKTFPYCLLVLIFLTVNLIAFYRELTFSHLEEFRILNLDIDIIYFMRLKPLSFLCFWNCWLVLHR